jgi:hypothetical protein
MQMGDHVGSALGAGVFASLRAIAGPLLSFVVIRSIRRGGVVVHLKRTAPAKRQTPDATRGHDWPAHNGVDIDQT